MKRNGMGKTWLALALSATALLAACGGDDEAADTASADTAAPAASSEAAPSASSEAAETTAAAAETTAAAAETTAAAELKPANVAYLNYIETDFVQAETDGLKKSVEASGGSVENFSANFDPQKQLQQCTDAITSGRFNAIVLDSVDPVGSIPCVKAAKEAGIPVVVLEVVTGPDINKVEPQVDGVVGSVVITAAANAKGMVDQTIAACEGIDPCKVIVEVSTPSDPFTNEVPKQLEAAGAANIEIVQTVVGQYDPATIQKSFADALSAHPDVNVFLSASDSNALAVLDQVKAAGLEGKLKLLGNGGSRRGAKAVADGTLVSTLGNWPFKMGEKAGEMAVKAVNGQPIEPAGVDALTLSEPFVLTKDTVGDFVAEWGVE